MGEGGASAQSGAPHLASGLTACLALFVPCFLPPFTLEQVAGQEAQSCRGGLTACGVPRPSPLWPLV